MDAEPSEIVDEWHQHAFKVAAGDHELEAQRLAGVLPDAFEVFDDPARFPKQPVRLEQRFAVAPVRRVPRQGHGMREHACGELIPVGLEEFDLGLRRLTRRLQARAHEERVVPFHAVVPVDPVRPLEVVRERQGFPDADVLEQRLAGIEDDGIVHAVRLGHCVGFLLEEALVEGVEVVGGCEDALVLVPVVVEYAGSQRLQHDARIEEVERLDAVEVEMPDVDVEVAAPVVVHALEGDLVARINRRDPVGTVPEGRLEGRGLEIPIRPVVLRQRCEPPGLDDEMGRLLDGLAEMEPERPGPRLLETHDVAVAALPTRAATLLDRVERPQDVGDSYGGAVVPIGVVAQRVGHGAQVIGDLHGFSEAAVVGRQFVLRLDEERIVDQSAQSRVEIHGEDALVDEGMQVVEGADHRHARHAPLRCGGVRVVEVRHVPRILQVAEVGEAVLGFAGRHGKPSERR